MNLYPLFASNLIETKFDDEESIKKLNQICKDIDWIVNPQEGNSGASATRNKLILEDYPEIKESLSRCFEQVNDNILQLSGNFIITTSWLTKSTKNSFSQFHTHRNSFYSAVLYFGEYSKNNKQAPIQFESPVADLPAHYIIPKKWNIHNCFTWDVYPSTGTLLFFPSYLRHRIGMHNDDRPRYSLAFNIVPYGPYGEGDSSYDTAWF
jgi:uncharacterized protein (TIGR02466 family)